MDQQIEQMLKKVATEVAKEDRSRFVTSIFVVPKKDSGHCPVISLKNLNYYIPYSHFKMVRLFPLKEILQEGDYMCKIDLKDAHFSVSLNQKSPKSVSFKWADLFYSFPLPLDRFGTSPKDIHKVDENSHFSVEKTVSATDYFS